MPHPNPWYLFVSYKPPKHPTSKSNEAYQEKQGCREFSLLLKGPHAGSFSTELNTKEEIKKHIDHR